MKRLFGLPTPFDDELACCASGVRAGTILGRLQPTHMKFCLGEAEKLSTVVVGVLADLSQEAVLMIDVR